MSDRAPKAPQESAAKPKADAQAQDATQASGSSTDRPLELEFTSDKGASRSTWLAGALVIAIVGWMGSGFIFPTADDTPVTHREAPAPVAVAVTASQAQSVTRFFRAEGQALPDRDTMLRAEISGDIAEVLVRKGQDVAAGAVIARFDPANNAAAANRAAEELARAQREFDNAEQLLERGISTADRVAQARAALAAAQADVTEAAQGAGALEITAPFAGRVETLDVNEGEFVQAGAQVGRLVDITPLTVAIQVPQQSLTLLEVGQSASVLFITGEERSGTVSFVGSSAASETRTFLAEIEIANENSAIPAGISAEVVIPTDEAQAHFLSTSIVSLDTMGTLGIKTVNADNTVQFYPVEVIKAQIDGIWVTGLPDRADVITVGQGFVSAGETVVPSASELVQ